MHIGSIVGVEEVEEVVMSGKKDPAPSGCRRTVETSERACVTRVPGDRSSQWEVMEGVNGGHKRGQSRKDTGK
ncbi:hypothetical protein M0804_001808 [Polistes exclamans]|nr:hypothetical protein M0804_001808 [Polistes exclamans]